jgi:prepilin-type N-terminal cleavage/methylation domain-containing protein
LLRRNAYRRLPDTGARLRAQAGFTLLEILIAMAILAFALAVISASASSSAIYGRRVYSSTTAALLLRGVLLDIEESYRKDGFPSNDLEGRDCELPKAYARHFTCEYDLIGLNLDEGQIADLTGSAQEVLAGAQEQLQNSGALDKLESSRGGAEGAKALDDLGTAAANAKDAGLDLTGMAKSGDMMSLITTILMSGEQGANLLDLCEINISVLQMSMGLMISELLPRILKRATDRTRKVRVRLNWVDAEGEDTQLEIETFTTAVSEEEARAITQMKDAQELQDAMQSTQPLAPEPP